VDLVDERGKDVRCRVGAAFLQCLPEILCERGHHAANGLDEMREEPDDVVVVPVDRQPRDSDALCDEDLAPLRGKGALAKSRRPVDDDQPM